MFVILLVFLAVSCGKDEMDVSDGITSWTSRRIAVIVPGSDGDEERYERTAEWFLENFQAGQRAFENGIRLELEWYDESSEDLKELAGALGRREDIAAVVGPMYSRNVDVFAREFAAYAKPMIVPVATSEDVVRRYSCAEAGTMHKSSFLWSMTETDISQAEVILATLSSHGCRNVALLSSDDVYGKTFCEWMPFLSKEMSLNLVSSVTYDNPADMHGAFASVMSSGAEYVICACRNSDDAVSMMQLRNEYGNDAPRLFFSDSALSSTLVDTPFSGGYVEGVSMYASPVTGFAVAYQVRFGSLPLSSEAQFYDSLLLAGISLIYAAYTGTSDLNGVIRRLAAHDASAVVTAWNVHGLQDYLTRLVKEDGNVGLGGASCEISFDEKVHTTILHSTYIHWMVYQGEFVPIGYTSSDKSNRVEDSLASWRWRAKQEQSFENEYPDLKFDDLRDRKALLVASSTGWGNYRHQADVLNVYSMLKDFGWSDDDIILVMSDDIAYNQKNPYQGQIRVSEDGDNLYDDVVLDYRLDDLTPSDICSILEGDEEGHLPVVLDTDSSTNLFLYWSGHGDPGCFLFGKSDRFTAEMLRDSFQQMSSESRYRKILFCAEPCFSGGMIKAAEGINGILGISSTNEYEFSFADSYSIELGAWMGDRFTGNLVRLLRNDPGMNYIDIYKSLINDTLGSHVCVSNEECFGNMILDDPSEFFISYKL